MANKKQADRIEPTAEQVKALAAESRAYAAMTEKMTALIPYSDNLPYNKERIVQECHFFLRHIAASKFELGRRLMILKEREDVQAFAQILEDDFEGMGKRSAFNYIAFAKRCIDLPKIKSFSEAKGNWSKVLALLNSCTEEQLKEIEEKGIKGKALDEFDGMSVRDFKRLLTKYKDNFDKTLAVETHNLKLERDEVLKERDAFKAQIEKRSPESILSHVKEMSKILRDFEREAQVVFDKRILDNDNLQIKIGNVIDDMRSRAQSLGARWDSFITSGEDD